MSDDTPRNLIEPDDPAERSRSIRPLPKGPTALRPSAACRNWGNTAAVVHVRGG
jgi:hypothetical protein